MSADADMNALIRRAAGRVPADERAEQPRDEQGRFAGGLDGGNGRGVGAALFASREDMNALIRAAAGGGREPFGLRDRIY